MSAKLFGVILKGHVSQKEFSDNTFQQPLTVETQVRAADHALALRAALEMGLSDSFTNDDFESIVWQKGIGVS